MKIVHPRRGIPLMKTPAKKSMTPTMTQTIPRISASAATVWKRCRRHRIPTSIEKIPINAYATRWPSPSSVNAITNRKIPATKSWMPNSTATTRTVRPGHATVRIPTSSVMIPNARTHPQDLPIATSVSAGSAVISCIAPLPGRRNEVSTSIAHRRHPCNAVDLGPICPAIVRRGWTTRRRY